MGMYSRFSFAASYAFFTQTMNMFMHMRLIKETERTLGVRGLITTAGLVLSTINRFYMTLMSLTHDTTILS